MIQACASKTAITTLSATTSTHTIIPDAPQPLTVPIASYACPRVAPFEIYREPSTCVIRTYQDDIQRAWASPHPARRALNSHITKARSLTSMFAA